MPILLEAADLQWFVVTGTPRSGTTLLAMLLNTHPGVGCLREVDLADFIRTFDALFAVGRDRERLALHIAANMERDPGGALLPANAPDPGGVLAREEAEAEHSRTLHAKRAEEFLHRREEKLKWGGVLDGNLHSIKVPRALVEIALGKSGLTGVGTKTPNLDLAATAGLFADLLPNLRFLHIFRRPVSVVNSSMARRNNARRGADAWHVNTVREACKEWMLDWSRAVSSREVLGDRLLMLKYEDLTIQAGLMGRLISGHLQVDNLFDFSVVEPLPTAFEKYALTPKEAEVADACFGEIERAWDQPLEGLFARFPRFGMPLDEGGVISFGLGGNSDLYLSEGFHPAEPWGRWTEGERAGLDILLPDAAGDILLDMQFMVWRAEADKPFEFVVAVASTRQLVTVSTPADGNAHRRSVLVPRTALAGQRLLSLRLLVLTPKTPSDPPLEDPRRIGLGLKTLQIRFLDV